MPNKCCVTGYRTNYEDGPKKPVFKFPDDPESSNNWVAFLNRRDYEISKYSVICIDDFEEKYIFHYPKNIILNYSMKPIPTIHPHLIPSSLATVPSELRKLPTVRIFQPDELQAIKSTFEIRSFADVTRHIKQSNEYSDLQLEIINDCITAYRVVMSSGVATVKECVHVDSNLYVKLNYASCPIPLPGYIDRTEGSKLTSLDMLANLPVNCRNVEATYETNIISELLKFQYYNPKGRPHTPLLY